MAESSENPTSEQLTRSEIGTYIKDQIAALRERTNELVENLNDQLDSVRIRIAAIYSPIRNFLIAAVIAGIIFTPISPRRENIVKYLEKETGRVDTAYVLIAGTDSGTNNDSLAWRTYFNHVIKDDIGIIFGITGDNYRVELEAGRLKILSGVPIDFDEDGNDDRVADISRLSTEQLAQVFETELQQIVKLAQQGKFDEVMIFVHAHGGLDKNNDWVGCVMNLFEAELFESTLYKGLKGMPDNIRVRLFFESCNSEGVVIGKARFTDIVPRSTVFYLPIKYSQPSRRQTSNYLYVETLYDGIRVPDIIEEVPDIRPSGSVEQLSSTLVLPYVEVVDMVRNTTSGTITYTVKTVSSTPGYTVTVPSSIVVNPNDSEKFTLFLSGNSISVTQFLTTTIRLAGSNGLDLQIMDSWDNPDSLGGLQFSPLDQPGSYRIVNNRQGILYYVSIPIANTTSLTANLVAVETSQNLRKRKVIVPPRGVSYITFSFTPEQWRTVKNIAIGIYSPTRRRIRQLEFDSRELEKQNTIFLPFYYWNQLLKPSHP